MFCGLVERPVYAGVEALIVEPTPPAIGQLPTAIGRYGAGGYLALLPRAHKAAEARQD